MPMIAWVVGDWRYMILATTLPCTVAFLLQGMMPESPRWLASRGKVKRAMASLQYIADVNGKQLPEDTLPVLEAIASRKEKTFGIPSLFSNARLAKNTFMIITCW